MSPTSNASPNVLTVHPGPRARHVRDADGVVMEVPDGWELLPPGDALVTRNVKAGPHWVVVEKQGRKVFTRGVWAPAATIARATAQAATKRASPEHARQLASGRARRTKEQAEYVVTFTRHVQAFLGFHPRHAAVASVLAERVAVHATPVGSGTVARTERIPVAERAEAAVIAWLRHQTTAYDRMSIARIKGERREVRRKLAARSRELLERYRRGEDSEVGCPLAAALAMAPGAISREVEEDEDEGVGEDEGEGEGEGVGEDEGEDEGVGEGVGVGARTLPLDPNDERLARMRAVRERLKRGTGKR